MARGIEIWDNRIIRRSKIRFTEGVQIIGDNIIIDNCEIYFDGLAAPFELDAVFQGEVLITNNDIVFE